MNSLNSFHSKVTTEHQAKLAYVYLRQLSSGKVLPNTESTVRQYALVDRAVALGWPKDRVQVIDEDLGRSGASADWRSGFQQLVTEVSLGHAGWCSRWTPVVLRVTTAIGPSCLISARSSARSSPIPKSSTTHNSTTTACYLGWPVL